MTQATFEPGGKVRRVTRRLDNPRTVLMQIGAVMVSESQRAFKDQKFGTTSWKPRSVPNVMGIVSDFHAGRRKPPARRFETRPALLDTGQLASSIAYQVSGMTVTVGSRLPYSGVHQKGGKTQSPVITAEMQTRIRSWLRTQSDSIANRLRFLTRDEMTGQRLQGSVPARPFVGITKWTERAIRKSIGVELLEVNR